MRVYEAQLVYNLISLGDEIVLDRPEKVPAYVEGAFAANPTVEHFVVILLDRKHHPLGRHVVTTGTLTSSLVHPREVFKPAILGSAASIIVSHNHPSSGDPAPSTADIQVTRQLREAGRIIGIDLLDHVIVGDAKGDPRGLGYYSFRTAGLL